MPIQYLPETKTFHLSTESASYVFFIAGNGRVVHLHCGAPVSDADALPALERRMFAASFAPFTEGEGAWPPPDALPQEFSGFNTGDYRVPACAIRSGGGAVAADPRYAGHRIVSGKPGLAGLPHSFAGKTDAVETLILTLRDNPSGTEFDLFYTVFPDCGAIVRSVKVRNTGNAPVVIERLAALQLDLEGSEFDLVSCAGSWSRERHAERTELNHGRTELFSGRGASGHALNPAFAVAERGADGHSGRVWGFEYLYSGNYSAVTELSQFDSLRVSIGMNPEFFSWSLEPGGEFQSPEAVLVFSEKGLGGMSRRLHDFLRGHVISPRWADAERPILINNWEATYFDFNTEKLLAIAKSASELGIEMLVLDDGWFGNRSDDTTSLGDWTVNEKKIGKLGDLVSKIGGFGLKFGLWFEPEMVSEKSGLYREHPDWCIRIPGRTRSLGRNQMILDMGRTAVTDYLFQVISGVLRSADVAYLKWDMNRNMTESYSAVLPADRQKEASHRYMLGVYRLLDMLLKAFPDLLIEGCSGGGGRFDAGMLFYSPQIWCSDDTDAMERLSIQAGTSLFYPLSAMGAHVSVCPNHMTGRTVPFETRGNIALAGTFGYELDLTKLSQEDRETVKRQTEAYHKYHRIVAEGDYYRLSNPFASNDIEAWCCVAKDRSAALVTAVRRIAHTHIPQTRIRPEGLDPDAVYALELPERTLELHGSTLMNLGFPAEGLALRDASSQLYPLRRI